MVQAERGRPGAAGGGVPLELWGGVECSVVHAGGRWRDQVRETGHHDRPGDLDLIGALGLRTLRYPVLWERCAPGPACCGWDWHDVRLAGLRDLGITPVVGLVHHGSGPPGADVLHPDWALGLAAHAAQAAARYPWVEAWTPVNEPLTTARFAALYGYWRPHATSAAAMDAMVVNQCLAVLLSMRAIRARIPGARLVQTEDLGRVFATPVLAQEAAEANERRWLSLDLLHGRVDRHHPAWPRLAALGHAPALEELRGGEARPDLLGINHYVTSDRFLDHRTHLYPEKQPNGGGRDPFVDMEAARIDLPQAMTGWEARLREAWRRYGTPLAITEAQLTCDDAAEPVRWLLEAWQAAHALRREGADIRAVTAWALFGAVDWDSMMQRSRGQYEPGVWDAGGGTPQPTLLARAAASLAATGAFALPELEGLGWWRRADRLHPAAAEAFGC